MFNIALWLFASAQLALAGLSYYALIQTFGLGGTIGISLAAIATCALFGYAAWNRRI